RRLDPGHDYTLTDSAVTRLKQHDYRGNVRELRNVLARALVFANTNVIDQHVITRCLEIDAALDTPVGRSDPVQSWTSTQPPDLKGNERDYLEALLRHCQGNKAQAAALAGISLRSLYRKLAA